MKRLLSFLAWGVLILVASLSEAQTAEPQPPVNKSAGTSRIVALNTNEIEGSPIDSGKLKFIASNEDTNGAFSIVERTQDPCYKTTWHRHDGYEESFYVLEGVWTVQIADKLLEFPAGSYVLIPRGTPHGQGNFTHRPVKLLVIVAPGSFDRFYRDRAELFETKGSNKAELEKGLEALRSKYIQVIDYVWNINKECR